MPSNSPSGLDFPGQKLIGEPRLPSNFDRWENLAEETAVWPNKVKISRTKINSWGFRPKNWIQRLLQVIIGQLKASISDYRPQFWDYRLFLDASWVYRPQMDFSARFQPINGQLMKLSDAKHQQDEDLEVSRPKNRFSVRFNCRTHELEPNKEIFPSWWGPVELLPSRCRADQVLAEQRLICPRNVSFCQEKGCLLPKKVAFWQKFFLIFWRTGSNFFFVLDDWSVFQALIPLVSPKNTLWILESI